MRERMAADACAVRSRSCRRLRTTGGRSVLIAIVLVAATATGAAASGLIPVTGSLGAGGATVGRCDSDGFTFANTIDASGGVTAVTVGGIALACAGSTLQLALTDASGTSLGSGTVSLPASGFSGSATVMFALPPAASQVAAYRAAITEP